MRPNPVNVISPLPWAPLTGATRDVAMEVLLRGPLSRSELARRLDLSPASLTRLTKPLLDGGLLVETFNEVVVLVDRISVDQRPCEVQRRRRAVVCTDQVASLAPVTSV